MRNGAVYNEKNEGKLQEERRLKSTFSLSTMGCPAGVVISMSAILLEMALMCAELDATFSNLLR